MVIEGMWYYKFKHTRDVYDSSVHDSSLNVQERCLREVLACEGAAPAWGLA